MDTATRPSSSAAARPPRPKPTEWDLFFEVSERLRRLLEGSDPNAGAKVVKLLHDPESGPRAFKALSNGMAPAGSSIGANLSFTEMCHRSGRVDILRAVYEAGAPKWLLDIKPLTADQLKSPLTPKGQPWTRQQLIRKQFTKLGYRLPKLETPQHWMDALCTRQAAVGHLPIHRSVFSVATDHIDETTRPFLAFWLEASGRHPAQSAEVMDMSAIDLGMTPSAQRAQIEAILRELQMRRSLDTNAATDATADAVGSPEQPQPPAAARRRAAL